MAKIRLEKVTGVVALGYLLLIPVVGVILHQRITKLDVEIQDLIFAMDDQKDAN